MSLKTSFFNPTIAKKGFKRTMPLWLTHAVIWVLVLTVVGGNLAKYYGPSAEDMGDFILMTAYIGGTLMAAFFSGALSEVLSNYLYSPSSIGFHHALPIKREAIFFTNYLTALGVLLIPAALTGFAANIVINQPVGGYLLTWFWMYARMVIFFTGFAMLCNHITGHVGIGFILYGILNFAAFLVEYCVKFIMSHFLYGFTIGYDYVTMPFSPIINIYGKYNIEPLESGGYIFTGQGYLNILLAVGLLFAAAAWLFYRARRSEDSREIISAHTLRPVFKYVFTAGCAVVLGVIFYFFFHEFRSGDSAPSVVAFAVATSLGGAIGYIGAEMLLQKSMKVLKRSWKGLAAAIAVILLCNGAIGVDVFGVVDRIPDPDDIESVTVTNYSYDYDAVVMPEDGIMDKVISLHSTILENKEYNESIYYDRYSYENGKRYSFENIKLEYKLKNGSTINRQYYVPLYYYDGADVMHTNEIYGDLVVDICTNPNVVMRAYAPVWDINNFYTTGAYCDFYGGAFNGYADYDAAVYAKIRQGVKDGLMDGTVKSGRVYGADEGQPYVIVLRLELLKQEGHDRDARYYDFTVAPDSPLAALLLDGKNVSGYSGDLPMENLDGATSYDDPAAETDPTVGQEFDAGELDNTLPEDTSVPVPDPV